MLRELSLTHRTAIARFHSEEVHRGVKGVGTKSRMLIARCWRAGGRGGQLVSSDGYGVWDIKDKEFGT